MKYEERINKYGELSKSLDNDIQKVGIIHKGNYIASNYIRILSPFSNLLNTEYVPYLIDHPDFNAFKKDLKEEKLFFDIIIVQRDALDMDFAKLLVEKCKLFGIKLIFEIDDDLINIDPSSPIYDAFLPKIKTMIYLAKNSNCITVSTNVLRDRMLEYNDNVITIPNALTDYWNLEKKIDTIRHSDSIKIGYMGTITHTEDLKMIKEVINRIQTKYNDKNINFEFIEGTTEELDGIDIIRVPQNQSYYPSFVSWLQNNIDWDIAIAPLVKENPINLSKSEIKYLEYTALNVPGVYSSVGPYEYAIEHEKNGMLVKDNTPQEWVQNLSKLIENIDLRRNLVSNAWEDVESNYLISNLVKNWINVLNSNKRDKSSLLYKKIREYYENNISGSFSNYLKKETVEDEILTNLKKYSECNFSEINSKKIGIFIKGKNRKYVATSYIRLLSIFNSISLDDSYFPYIIDKDDINNVINDLNNENFLADVIIIQRDVLQESITQKLIDYCKLFDIKIIFEIDDDLINISTSHPEYDFYIKKVEMIKFILRNSDEVVVSTEALKNKLLPYNKNISVIQNTLIEFWKENGNYHQEDENSIKIGYMGTVTHANDLKLVKDSIVNVKNFYKNQNINVEFEMIGGTDEHWEGITKIETPKDKEEYPYFVKWLKQVVNWDIAIAPLEDNNINKSKSLIKYLEYSALGVPGIYSPVGPYKEHIINNENGILVNDNSVNSWTESLKKLIEDETLRRTIRQNSKKDIENNFSMESSINHWKRVLNRLSRNKNSVLNYKIKQYMQNNSKETFIDFLNAESRDIIIKSGLFDQKWYLSEYVDVKINKLDPINHFLELGFDEGCKPSSDFNQNIQSAHYPKERVHPFVYYILYSDIDIAEEYENFDSNIINSYEYNFNKHYLDNFTVTEMIDSLNNVTIIIPIYNAYEDTKKCLTSVFKNTHTPFNLILINDNSTDTRIKSLLDEYEMLDNVTVFHNEINNGFTKNVNFGIRYAGDDDVVLLNSDTMVTPNWLQKLLFIAYSQNNIGTVTPFSNASDIKVPTFWGDDYPDLEEINNMGYFLSNLNPFNKLYAATGNGFCLFIKRKTILDIGLFDEKSFGKGYGEETDFTMRAKNRGWLNCRTPSVFIYHKKSASFSLEKADILKKEHQKVLLSKHPNVFEEWNKFYFSDTLKQTLNNIKKNINNEDNTLLKRNILYITTIRNNYPFIEDYDKLNNKFNIYCLTYDDDNLMLWAKFNKKFTIIKKISLEDYPNIHELYQYYINIFIFFNIFDVFINHTIVTLDLENFSEIFPFVLFDKLGLSLFYIRPNFLNQTIFDNSNFINKNVDFKKNKCVVYTAITGGYDDLKDPEYINPNFDYICFTDDPNLKSNIWEIRLMEYEDDNIIRKARRYKILPHKYLSDYDYSFWIDGGIKIVGDLQEYVNKYLKENSMLVINHISRNCIYDESHACIRLNKDNEDIINNQMDKYKKLNYPKENGLIESTVLFRKHNDTHVINVMEDWFKELSENSIRDQLSFNYIAWKNNFQYDKSDIIVWRNQYVEHAMKHNK